MGRVSRVFRAASGRLARRIRRQLGIDLLLDTATLIYLDLDSPSLSPKARRLIVDVENRLFMSAVNVWELYLKSAIGKLSLPDSVPRFVNLLQSAYDITSLSLSDDDLAPLATLPMRHRDPFDRALIAQSISRRLLFVTPDRNVRAYPEVRTAW